MKSNCLRSLAATGVLFAAACAAADGSEPGQLLSASGGGAAVDAAGGTGGMGSGTGGSTSGASTSGGSGGELILLFGGTAGTGTSPGSGGTCAAQTTEASLRPVFLAFAFDVSSSMGSLEMPYFDPVLKWEPVVAATEAFFADPDSAAISASLTFFPDVADICLSDNYAVPDVPMTPLPSAAFAAAIQAITPTASDAWRRGTPTLSVVTGTLAWLQPLAAADPASVHALVLVTDGAPTSCEDNSIEAVSAAVAAVSGSIPTYVIGVQNPPGGPDAVTNLQAIATAGGTEQAFIIETGDPEKTRSDFKAVIDGIRGRSVSCEIEIPEPPLGQEFVADRVNVTYTSGALIQGFAYDQACATENTWHYDDPASPMAIVLCPTTCALAQADPAAKLLVEFGCDTRLPRLR